VEGEKKARAVEAARRKRAAEQAAEHSKTVDDQSKARLDDITLFFACGLKVIEAQFKAVNLIIVISDATPETVMREFDGHKQTVSVKGSGVREFRISAKDQKNDSQTVVVRIDEKGRVFLKEYERSHVACNFEQLKGISLKKPKTCDVQSITAITVLTREILLMPNPQTKPMAAVVA
jgi:hypothetical protein